MGDLDRIGGGVAIIFVKKIVRGTSEFERFIKIPDNQGKVDQGCSGKILSCIVVVPRSFADPRNTSGPIALAMSGIIGFGYQI